MHVFSKPAEASTRLSNFIVEALNRTLIVLSVVLAVATVASVA